MSLRDFYYKDETFYTIHLYKEAQPRTHYL